MIKKVPERTCMACNKKMPKQELLRIVKSKEENVEVDLTGKKNGRGAYICKNIECLEKIVKTNKLERTFEIKLSNEIYENIRKAILDE